MSEQRITFLDELPPRWSSSQFDWFWDALVENPGKWARWPGSQNSRAMVRTKHGRKFEARQQAGVVYVRCVPE